jgi:hypothetical protein
MTVSNSANMTTAERLAQKIKDSPLGALLDEDDLTTIAADAIKKAFFQSYEVKEGYNTVMRQPRVIDMVKEAFHDQVSVKMQPAIDALATDEEFAKIVHAAVMAQIPIVAEKLATGMISRAMIQTTLNISNALSYSLGQKLGVSISIPDPSL